MRFTIVIATLGAALLAALAVTAGASAGNASAATGSITLVALAAFKRS